MYKKLSKNFMLHFVDSYYKEFSVQISQFVDSLRVFPIISLNTGNFDIAAQSFWLDYGEFYVTIELRSNSEQLKFKNILCHHNKVLTSKRFTSETEY